MDSRATSRNSSRRTCAGSNSSHSEAVLKACETEGVRGMTPPTPQAAPSIMTTLKKSR